MSSLLTEPNGLVATPSPSRAAQGSLVQILRFAIVALLLKVLTTILLEYQNDVPPNFRAPFLIGRESTFFGLYAHAFYVHLACGPLVAAVCLMQMSSRIQRRLPTLHRISGRLLLLVTVIGLLPSGLVMAIFTRGGAPALWGFVAYICLTAYFCVATWRATARHDIVTHRRHATRLAILLLPRHCCCASLSVERS